MLEREQTTEQQVADTATDTGTDTVTDTASGAIPAHTQKVSNAGVSRDWLELVFILLYPLVLPIPVVNVVAGVLAAYAVLSLVARKRAMLAIVGCVLSLGLSALFATVEQLTASPVELNLAMTALALVPALVLATGFRMFAGSPTALRSSLGLMALVTILSVSVLFVLGENIFDGLFKDLAEYAQQDPKLDSAMIAEALEQLRWLTPALIATQVLVMMFLTWYLAPTIERLVTGGRSVALATSANYRWLTLTQWRLPVQATALVFVLAAGRLLADTLDVETMTRICDNLLLITLLAFSLTGFALVEYAFRRFRVSWLMRGVFYFLAVVSALPGAVFLALVGLIDTQFDLRSRMAVRTNDSSNIV